MTDFDFIIVGSGPAGVSAAFPLVKAGFRVLMVDGGKSPGLQPPNVDFLAARQHDPEQWRWLIGQDFHALRMQAMASPKLRVPGLSYVFDQFTEENGIISDNFMTIGSLARGGLSNAWGCGVACFSNEELKAFPCDASDMKASYAAVAKRIGISGGTYDELSNYFGVDEWAMPPVEMDPLHNYLHNRYQTHKIKLASQGFKLGRTRIALLTNDFHDRKACSLLGNCLWGCANQALYSSASELPTLLKHNNFSLHAGFIVQNIVQKEGLWAIEGKNIADGTYGSITAKKILLAAGTLASTRLALKALNHYESTPLFSCPTAAFMLWLPRFLGSTKIMGAGIGQLGFTISLADKTTAFGATFITTGINTSEFIKHAPFKRRYGIDIFRYLLSSCMAGNVFLPGHLTHAATTLQKNNQLLVRGEYKQNVALLMAEVAKKLRYYYTRLGAVLLPKSFTLGKAGGDVHYAGTLPMQKTPVIGETTTDGEIASLRGVYIVDGACLPILPEKSHTLTIMANADRIAKNIALTSKN